jgi:hypothetical protein
MAWLVYSDVPGALQTTNGTPNTANDCFFVSPGTRTLNLQAVYVQGRGSALTSISGISFRIKRWTTTASSGGSAITPSKSDIGAQNAKHSSGYSASAVTPGTGGPTLLKSFGCGAAGPGGWVAPNPDTWQNVEASANMSLDVDNISGTASLNFEMSAEVVE